MPPPAPTPCSRNTADASCAPPQPGSAYPPTWSGWPAPPQPLPGGRHGPSPETAARGPGPLAPPSQRPARAGTGKEHRHSHLHRVGENAGLPAMDPAPAVTGPGGDGPGLLSHQGAGQRPGPEMAGVLPDAGAGRKYRGADRRRRERQQAGRDHERVPDHPGDPGRVPRLAAPALQRARSRRSGCAT